MGVWMIAVSLAAIVFFQGDNIFFLMFNDALKNDSWGLATAFIKAVAPWVKYLLIGMILSLAYGIRNKQSMRLQATVMGAPRCPRCGRRMVFGTAGLGFFFWEHFWGSARYPFCRGREEIEA